MALWEKILTSRRRARLTQGQLAERLEVNRATVSKWERDESLPGLSSFSKMSRIFEWKDESVIEVIKTSEKWPSCQ